MNSLLAALAALAIAGALALISARSPRRCAFFGAAGPVLACLLAAAPTLAVLTGGPSLSARWPWSWPFVSIALGLDPLSGVFLAVILILGAVTAVYGVGYLREMGTSGARAVAWFFFNLLLASMVLVVLARNGLVFLVAWETMALTSFFLIAFDHERREVRRAAWTYLVATHLGSLFLLPLFFILGQPSASLDFGGFSATLAPGLASACFLLAVVGFGTKAGLMPFHVWLPEAHPAAPSHVSALLSAVMIKMGIYGLLRMLTFLGEPPLWWGWLLVGLGGASALLGILFALAQHDLKRLLAFSSVENVGIVFIGLGVGVIGRSVGDADVAALGFAGALLHVVNHALFKGLLFLGAGSVLHATGTAEVDALGGLARRQPLTAATFLVGSVAICGLPPLCGFLSEFLIYWGALDGVVRLAGPAAMPLAALVPILAAVGGLALACFTKAFGIAFLGEARSAGAAAAHEAPPSMRAGLVFLAASCVAVGLAGPFVLGPLALAIAPLTPASAVLPMAATVLWRIIVIAATLAGLVLALALTRRLLLRRRDVRTELTWDCGYAAPTPRMQYTGSSFSQPVVDLYVSLLRTRKRIAAPEIHFPDAARLETETRDVGREEIYEPLFEGAERLLKRMRILQHGRVQVYVLSMVLTLVILLLWHVR
jgi:hydrogenase-4 component B